MNGETGREDGDDTKEISFPSHSGRGMACEGGMMKERPERNEGGDKAVGK